MIEQLKIILIIVCSLIILIDLLSIVEWLKGYFKINRRIKPFDCSFCLTFWISLIVSTLIYSNIIDILFISTVAPLLNYAIINKIIK